MRILVTGGAGYVGSASVEALLAAGHDVSVLDDLSTGHADAVPNEARLEVWSYTDEAELIELLDAGRIEAILHCAARSLVGESALDPARYYRENVAGGIALLEAARQVGVGRIVFSSTASVYGIPDSTPIYEDAPLRPINTYGETKRTFEAALAAYGAAYGLRSVSLRYFNVAGATERNGEVHDPETHLVPNLLRAADGTGEPVTIFGDDYPTPDGTCVRDYIHVSDLADAHLLALEATMPDDERSAAPLALNLGTARGFSVREVLAAAESVLGRPIPHTIGDRRAGDPPTLVASSARAEEVLGWEAKRSSLEEMIASAWEWRQRNPEGYAAD
jgi:UDP-glucose 4-epimerase